METADFVIIGGGPAGVGAFSSLPESSSAVLLEARESLMYSLSWMKSVHFNDTTGTEFSANVSPAVSKRTAKREDKRIHMEERVFRIDRENKIVYSRSSTDNLHEYRYGTLIVAVGAIQIVYGRYLLPGVRAGRIFTTYQVGEMLQHYDFIPGKRIFIFGESPYTVETALAARDAGLEVEIGIPGDDTSEDSWRPLLPDGATVSTEIAGRIDDIPVHTGVALKQIYGGTLVEGVLLQKGNREFSVSTDSFVVDGDFVLEHAWRYHLDVEWNLREWRLDTNSEEMRKNGIILVGDAYRPNPNFQDQFTSARKAALPTILEVTT